jgi:hypothetical protein
MLSRILQDSTLISNHFIQYIQSDFEGIRAQVLETRQAIDLLLKDKANEGQSTNYTETDGRISLNGLQETGDDEEGDISRAQVSMLPA